MGDDWDVEIYPVSDSGPLIEAIDKGNADIGFVDGAAAWLAWEVYDLDVLQRQNLTEERTTMQLLGSGLILTWRQLTLMTIQILIHLP